MQSNKNVILDLCGGTGAWSQPYKEAGYTVVIATLPEYDVVYVKLDLYLGKGKYGISFRNQITGTWDYVAYEDICGILAAPPCTEFSVAKTTRPRDFTQGMKPVEACMQIIWEAQKHTRLDFWALENPRGFLRRFLGIPKYTFEQWQFGGDMKKATDIWGYFNIPTPTNKTNEGLKMKEFKGGRIRSASYAGAMKIPAEYADYISTIKGHDAKRAAVRAITPAGFAQAFYKANKPRQG
ncbi:MAG: hypothetical protein FWE42_00925 [Defluviitaleaceae bacterium]|nr:hypothetical protein [Defluviitaleaceae bacterium]